MKINQHMYTFSQVCCNTPMQFISARIRRCYRKLFKMLLEEGTNTGGFQIDNEDIVSGNYVPTCSDRGRYTPKQCDKTGKRDIRIHTYLCKHCERYIILELHCFGHVMLGIWQGDSVVQWYRAGLLISRSRDRPCTRGMIHKIHPISPGCPSPNLALQCRIVS